MKYAIWNKKDSIITPSGHIFTATEWMDMYPVAQQDNVDIVCAEGEVNGAVFSTLGALVEQYKEQGCSFDASWTAAEKIDAINNYVNVKAIEAEAARAQQAEEAKAMQETQTAALASIAAQLEYQNMMTLEDVEVE